MSFVCVLLSPPQSKMINYVSSSLKIDSITWPVCDTKLGDTLSHGLYVSSVSKRQPVQSCSNQSAGTHIFEPSPPFSEDFSLL
jgi:hypothetical protein